MTIALGIDTGGAYTDAVLVDHNSGQVLAGAKALTTRRDLSIGIGQAVAAVFAENGQAVPPAAVDLVALSTTLATNAIIEDQGSLAGCRRKTSKVSDRIFISKVTLII
jgi:N-methylhydantoinase A/oxoprolinase/acetone carboxylase beta subunit